MQTAIEFFHKGLRTIEDLRRNQHLLNDNQKVNHLNKYNSDFLGWAQIFRRPSTENVKRRSDRDFDNSSR